VVIVHLGDSSGGIDVLIALFVLTFSLQQPEPRNYVENYLSSILIFDHTVD
jgi:hypothetical protein